MPTISASTKATMSLDKSSEKHALEMSLHQEFGMHSVRWGELLGGFSSRNTALSAQTQSFVLKQYSQTAAKRIARLETIALFLKRHDFPAPIPLPTRTQKLHFSCQNQTYALFLRNPGTIRHGDDLSPKHLQSAAEALAALHLLPTSEAAFLGSANRPLHRDATALRPLLCKTTKLVELAAEDVEVVEESMRIKSQIIAASNYQRCNPAEREKQFVHGDFHNENLLFLDDARVSCVLDFEESFLGRGVVDVVNFFFLACCNEGLSPKHLSIGRQFLKFYQSCIAVEHDAIQAAVERYFLAMASSTFFEEQLLEGKQFAARLLKRDISKMRAWQHQPEHILDAFT